MKKKLTIFPIITALSPLFANNYIVSHIDFSGLDSLSKNSAKELLGFDENSVPNDSEINSAIKRLYSQGYFDDIEVKYYDKNETIQFIFIEKSRISQISITGFLENDEEKQKEFLKIKKGSFVDNAKINSTKNKILDALDFTGTIDNIVEVHQVKLDNGTTELEFIAREGEQIIIKKLEFDGLKSFSHSELENQITNRAEEGFGWLIGRNDGKMKIKEAEIDSERIREFYMERGFIDVIVSKPIANIDFYRYIVTIKYKINEGEKYKINNINFDFIDEVPENLKKELLKFKLKKDQNFNIKYLRDDIQNLKNIVADLGYAFVEISPDVKKINKNSLDIIYKIKKGNRVKIRNVIISGNRLTLDRIVRREIYLAPNDFYNLTDLKDSKNSLGRLGYFDDVQIKEEKISDNEIDLIVSVKEGQSGMVQVGGGYSTYLGLTFDAGISDRNIFGSGIDLGFALQISKISTNYSITLTNQRINDSLYSGSFSVNRNKHEYDYYTVKDVGFDISIGRKFTRNIKSSIGYSYSDVQYSDISANFDTTYTESYLKSSIFINTTYDTTDDYFTPREGLILADSIEYAGLSGDAKFLKNTLSFNSYFGLNKYIDYDLILRSKSKLRTINDNGFIPINESIYMGGISSIRGYDGNAFPNRDIYEYKYIKAKKSFTQSIEASIPISAEAKMRLTGFVDYGWIGVENFDMANRGGYGISLDWISPMAPIQFIFSRPFNDKPGDELSKFEFTMGRRF